MKSRRPPCFLVLVALLIAWSSGSAGAQTISDRNDPDPAEGASYRSGTLAWTPALVVSFGHDTNVYREPTGFADYELFLVPQIETWLVHPGYSVRMIGAVELVHFANNIGATNTQAGIRFDRRQSVVRPFFGLNHRRTNANPTGFEVGYKSLRLENEIVAGAGVKVSPRSTLAGTLRLVRTGWDADAIYQSSSLKEKLNRDTSTLSADYAYTLTPLTSIGGRVESTKDRFKYSPIRDGETLRLMSVASFARQALIFGTVALGYENFKSDQAEVADFSGLIGATSVGYGRPDGTLAKLYWSRDTAYSYDTALAYYVMSSTNVTLSKRIGTSWDVAGFLGRYKLDYRPPQLADSIARVDTVIEYGGAAAYRVGRLGRVGVTMEHAQRDGVDGFKSLRIVGFLTYGSGRFQRLDRPTPFER
jgi:hypothetical protein